MVLKMVLTDPLVVKNQTNILSSPMTGCRAMIFRKRFKALLLDSMNSLVAEILQNERFSFNILKQRTLTFQSFHKNYLQLPFLAEVWVPYGRENEQAIDQTALQNPCNVYELLYYVSGKRILSIINIKSNNFTSY